MKTVIYFACKGGVGKTRYAMLTANYLAKVGKRVLLIDIDCSSNSSTFYYMPVELIDGGVPHTHNVAMCLFNPQNDMNGFVVPSVYAGVDLLASDRHLVDLRSIEERRLKIMLKAVESQYDFVIIDCQSDYNAITLNAIAAADLIITPMTKDLDSLNSAVFLDDKLTYSTDKRDVWFISINGWDRRYAGAVGGRQRDYVREFESRFGNMLDRSMWFPWKASMNDLKDYHRLLAGVRPDDQGLRGQVVVEPELFGAVACLCDLSMACRWIGLLRSSCVGEVEGFLHIKRR